MIRWISATDFQQQPKLSQWQTILLAFTLAMLPLLLYFPFPYGLLFSAVIILRWLTLYFKWQRVALWLLVPFIPAVAALIYFDFRSQGYTYSFLALLAAMACAKLLESRNYRDFRVLFLLSILLILAFLMYSTSMLVFLYAVIVLGVSIWALMRIEHRHSRIVSFGRWGDILKLLILSLPLAIILFFFFPRIDPLWGIQRPAAQNITGLPEEMRMGDIGFLAQSNDIAFRVKFADGQVPAAEKLYWRGPVLWFFDGQNWRQWARNFTEAPKTMRYREGSEVVYEVMIANDDLDWLLALDLPMDYPKEIQMGSAYQLRLPASLKGMQHYSLVSALDYRISDITRDERRVALQLPKSIPKTQALATQIWRDNGQTTQGFVQGFLQYLREEEFYYSLDPLPGAGDVETFLFDGGRIGFCEHYASAMAQAARSINIPARVILGYQGGELNPLNGDWLVREESAHAWVEIWFDDLGWVRVDPTAAVAPERILQARLSSDFLTGSDRRALSSRFAERLGAFAWARNVIAFTQAFWQDWVIELNRNKQESFFAGSALGRLGKIISMMVIILSVWILSGWYFFWWQRQKLIRLTPLQKALQKLMKRLAKQGYERRNAESVAKFFRRIAKEFPEQTEDYLLKAAYHYECVRYFESENDSYLIKIIKHIRL